MNVRKLVLFSVVLLILAISISTISAQDGCRQCIDGSPNKYLGGTVYSYFVYPCDNWRCIQYPSGQRQAVITTYALGSGMYSTCCCTPCGLDPFRVCPVAE